MKKLLYILLAVSIIFAACKKEEEEMVTPLAASIVGVWTPTSVLVDSSTTATVMGQIVYSFDTTYTMTPTDEEFNEEFPNTMEFTTDGTMYVDEGDGMITTNSYTYSANLLIVTDEEGTETKTYTVTSTSLVIMDSDTETYTDDYMGQEATITVNYDMTLNCTRQ